MKKIQMTVYTACLVSILATMTPVHAEEAHEHHHEMSAEKSAMQPAGTAGTEITDAASLAEGEVRKLDAEAGKITIRHGVIPQLDMPPMTMVFHVRSPALLEGVKVGEKIRFAAVQEGSKLIVTELHKQ